MRPLLRQLCVASGLLALVTLPVSAQQPTTLTGTVVSETGQPVEAATVFIESLNLGVLTNSAGRYVLIVSAGARPAAAVEVRASQIGRTSEVQSVTLQPGTQVLNFTLGEDPLRVEGITVTALGMERQTRELTIATQQLESSELTRAEPNLVNTLSGKIAGVNITNSGPQGGSSRIVIRGASSLTGQNQPLFVVDGIPIDNSIDGRVGILTDQGGFDYGNPISDINPDDIESITVLKGPNAAALYGSRAANGAVIIETKTGQGTVSGAEVVVSQQVTFENILRLPKYQNQFGEGYVGEFSYYDGLGNGLFDEADESWGPPLDYDPDGDGQVLMIPQWFSAYDPLTDTREPAPWVSHPDNVRNFFETGVTSTTNVSVAGSTDRAHGRAAFSRMDLNGMTPGHEQERMSFSFSGGFQALERLDINASAQYVASDGRNRPAVGYGPGNPMNGFIWSGRQNDTQQLKELWTQTRPLDEPNIGGYPYSWTTLYSTGLNPYYLTLGNRNEDNRDRLIGQISATYQFTDWLSGMVRSGTDWYQDERLRAYSANPQAANQLYTTNPVTGTGRDYVGEKGAFGLWAIGSQETNTDFLVTASPELDLPFTTTVTVGGNRRDWERSNDYTWVGQLGSAGIYDVGNAASLPTRDTRVEKKRINSLYGQADFGYENYLFLTVTGRNDWSSTLPKQHRSYFYPSVSTSFVFSDVVESLQGSALSYGKLRASWARVGNDTDPYRLRDVFQSEDLFGQTATSSQSSRLENPELKPETTESWEFGTELAFLDNRLGLDVTYYKAETRDQLMPVKLSKATGYDTRMANAGTVENKGWEVLLRGTPYSSSDFRWESTLTWSKNDSKVVKLAEGVTGLELTIAEFWGAQLFAREGEPLGQIVGSAYSREDLDGDGKSDPNGRVVVDADGGYPLWDNNQVIGNVNPDWRAGWGNEFSYKGVRLGVLFDMRQGGQIYSVTNAFGRFSGVLEETVAGRCTPGGPDLPGYPTCTPETGIVFDGVNEVTPGGDGTPGEYVENETVIDAESLWFYNYVVEQNNLEDGSYIKLREVTLSYSLPESLVGRWGVDGVDVSLVGRNLALWTDARHIDPETSMEGTNVQGFEYGQMPSARSFGINVTVRP